VKHVRVSGTDVELARAAAEKAGLRLASLEKRPDGTVKLEFGEFAGNSDIVIGKRNAA
jgi:hypothetical protein